MTTETISEIDEVRATLAQLIGATALSAEFKRALTDRFVRWYVETHPRTFPQGTTGSLQVYLEVVRLLQEDPAKLTRALTNFRPVRSTFFHDFTGTSDRHIRELPQARHAHNKIPPARLLGH